MPRSFCAHQEGNQSISNYFIPTIEKDNNWRDQEKLKVIGQVPEPGHAHIRRAPRNQITNKNQARPPKLLAIHIPCLLEERARSKMLKNKITQ
ncbi:unnamed protein product [Moneuplotes crassus]|uniref:Uncharacterized protein n=1 Tax=Euplotes crassus TaxID=5936 RepID=A0AAD1Y960_EUPCR|nr:unnamed protein product [Moneuplotes crassus]